MKWYSIHFGKLETPRLIAPETRRNKDEEETGAQLEQPPQSHWKS